MSKDIQTLIQELANPGKRDLVSLFDAEVKSVDLPSRTCIVYMLGGNASNEIQVRLMASVDDGSFMIPKVGSTVVVSMSSYVEPFVSMYSEIESIVWLGGEYEEVPIVKHPSDANKGLLIKIRNIESLLNHLITNYNDHTHVLTLSAGTGTAAPTITQETGSISPTTTQADISHTKIKH